MRASRVHHFGPPDVIVLDDVPKPAPGAGEVLVRVHAAGVGPWDGWIRSGKSVLPQPLPLTLGSDLSGIVAELGTGVTDLAVGDEVYGVTNTQFTGACADYAVATAGMIAKKPRSVSYVEAASVPVVAVTAWQMLFDHAGLKAGHTVLILGGAGNVGAYAIQFARLKGVRVIATDVAEHVSELRRLGADQAVDVGAVRFEDVTGPVDAVIDTLGGESQRRALSVVAPGGVVISAVSQPDASEVERRGVRASFMLVNVNTRSLIEISALIDGGTVIKPRVGLVLPITDVIQAHELLEGLRKPRPAGKIVIDVLGTQPQR
jgi:NADPH:quinone reductase-like Zn-dependent oxidoreductase